LKKIVFFGDSITHAGILPNGYIDLLIKGDRNNHFQFIESGVNGHKIYDLYSRLDQDVIAQKPDTVVIFIGVNDVWHKQLFKTGTAYHDFEKFYIKIIDRIREHSINIILCTPAVIGEKKFYNEMDFDLDDYSSVIEKIAQKYALPFINLRKIFKDYLLQNNPNDVPEGILTYDGVHLNDKGNELVAQTMWVAIK
jgi:isoamyl acetate esterase